MPAVQGARESGRRATCANNLKQLGLAGQQHVEKLGYFPSSGWGYMYVGDPDWGFGHKQPGGWMYDLLPFMGLTNIHQIGADISDFNQKKAALAELKQAVVPLFHCPTRRRAVGYPRWESSWNANSPNTFSKTDYAANGGTVRILGTGPRTSCYNTYPNCNWTHSDDWMANHFDGISSERSEIRPAHVTDGLSRTFFAGEKYLNPEYYYTGNCCADNNSAYQGNDWDLNRWTGTGADRKPLQDTPGYENCTTRFGSSHTVGVNFAFCDGSVHMVNFDIDMTIYSKMGSRADGDKFNIDF
jgi:prepilin-type processing-associated H-X9-DG protein